MQKVLIFGACSVLGIKAARQEADARMQVTPHITPRKHMTSLKT